MSICHPILRKLPLKKGMYFLLDHMVLTKVLKLQIRSISLQVGFDIVFVYPISSMYCHVWRMMKWMDNDSFVKISMVTDFSAFIICSPSCPCLCLSTMNEQLSHHLLFKILAYLRRSCYCFKMTPQQTCVTCI